MLAPIYAEQLILQGWLFGLESETVSVTLTIIAYCLFINFSLY